ncbi:hypothetical protein ACSQ67_005087 [Phaseolus vulgaris]
MASKLQQLQSKACQASQFVAKHGSSYYRQLLEQNKQHIQEPPTVERCNLLAKQLLYTRLARLYFLQLPLFPPNSVYTRENVPSDVVARLSKHAPNQSIHYFGGRLDKFTPRLWHGSIPGRTESFWKELDYAKNLWKNRKELKVEDAGIAALFGLECFAWFCAGEIVGRGFTFTGYYV